MNQEQNQKMMEWSTAWLLDGDLCRCRKCKRGIVMSRSAESFIHAAGCSQAHLDSPWRDLRAIITPPPSTEPAPQSVGEKWWTTQEFGKTHLRLTDSKGITHFIGDIFGYKSAELICAALNLLAGHDLPQAVVVDKAVVEKVRSALQYGCATHDKFTRDLCREALTSFNEAQQP